ncbi:hypothetical protein BC829DRAFT_385241 [Chytridium lagenaria]|nr:hypothetical protein BC829DRAFT_385241 [Chytridium lagenaria]
MGVVFLVLQGIGLGVGFMGVWTYLGEMEQDGWCRMRSWTQWMGYSIFIQGLLPKLYRIFRVCENRSLIKRITHLEDRNLLILSLPISLPNIILLLTWQFSLPFPQPPSLPQHPRTPTTSSAHPQKSALYAPLLIIYNTSSSFSPSSSPFSPEPSQNPSTSFTASNPSSSRSSSPLVCITGGASNYVATTAVIVALVFVAMVVIMAGTVGRAAWIALKAKERNESLGSGRSMGSRSLRSRGARSRRSEEETGKRDLEKGDKEVKIVKNNMTEDGLLCVTIPVKDTSRLLSLWKKSTISICPKTALITIINTDTQIGLTSFFTPQTLQPPSPSHPNCVLLRMGPLATTSRQNASIHICQFRNASAISEFLALIAGIAEQSGVSSNAPDGKL